MTLLEQYRRGEQAQVWAELMDSPVREEPLRAEAWAVATETMQRVRHNVTLLAERLRQLGYWFLYPDQVLLPPDPSEIARLRDFEARVGPVPLSVAAWIETVGTVDFTGRYPRLSYYHLADHSLMQAFVGGDMQVDQLQNILGKMGLPPTAPHLDGAQMQELLRQVNAMMGSMRGLMNELDPSLMGVVSQSVDRGETKAKTAPPIAEADRVLGDPLVVSFEELDADGYLEWQEFIQAGETNEPYRVTFAPDLLHKANFSGGGGYEILLPDARADARLGTTTFVEYLRRSFQWGGFPGLEDEDRRDQALIESLTEGLLPI